MTLRRGAGREIDFTSSVAPASWHFHCGPTEPRPWSIVTAFLLETASVLYSPRFLSRMPIVKELGRNKDLQTKFKALRLDPA